MNKIYFNITEKFVKKFVTGIWVCNGLIFFKAREKRNNTRDR